MTTKQEALNYGLTFPDTYIDTPFRDANWQVVRLHSNKKIFLWTYERGGYVCINIKVDPEWRDLWRATYPSFPATTRTKNTGAPSSWTAPFHPQKSNA